MTETTVAVEQELSEIHRERAALKHIGKANVPPSLRHASRDNLNRQLADLDIRERAILRNHGSPGEQFVNSTEFRNAGLNPMDTAVTVRGFFEYRDAIGGLDRPTTVALGAPPPASSPVAAVCNRQPAETGDVQVVRWPFPEAGQAAEGEAKTEADLTPTISGAWLPWLNHYVPVSRKILEDRPAVQNLIDGRLRFGLALKIDTNIVAAISADTEIPTATATDVNAAIRTGIGSVGAYGHTINAALINPASFADLDPGTLQLPTSIVPSAAVPPNTVLVGDFIAGVTVFALGEATVITTDAHGDNFLRNRIVILAEQQAAGYVSDPSALVAVTIG